MYDICLSGYTCAIKLCEFDIGRFVSRPSHLPRAHMLMAMLTLRDSPETPPPISWF